MKHLFFACLLTVSCAEPLKGPTQNEINIKMNQDCVAKGGKVIWEYNGWNNSWYARWCIPPEISAEALRFLETK